MCLYPSSSAQRTALTVVGPLGTCHTPRPSSGISLPSASARVRASIVLEVVAMDVSLITASQHEVVYFGEIQYAAAARGRGCCRRGRPPDPYDSSCCERGTCQSGDVSVCVGVALNAPAAFRRLGDEHPGPLGQRWISSRRGDDLGQFLHHAELFVSIENVDGSEHLDSHVVAVSGCVRD